MKRDVCILGLGLIGGSLMKDLQAAGHPVFGFNRSPSAVNEAAAEGFQVSASLKEVLEEAEARRALIVVATPMPAVAGLLDQIKILAPSCGITDVVSVKSEVLRLVEERGLSDRYVGGHPMAGTAESGWQAAHTGLFHNAAWVIGFDRATQSPEADIPSEWVDIFTDVVTLAQTVGAQVIPATVARHDAAVARISHMPHLLAEALAIVGDNGGALSLSLAAGSFRDGTRVAGTAPSLVRAMCETNNEAVIDALDEVLSLLADARANLAANKPSVEEITDAGYRSRIRYEARAAAGGANRPIIRLQPGTPGWVAQLTQAENLGARIEIFEL